MDLLNTRKKLLFTLLLGSLLLCLSMLASLFLAGSDQALIEAVQKDDAADVKVLLDRGVNANVQSTSLKYSFIDRLKDWLQHRQPPKPQPGPTALELAAKQRDPDLVKLLLDHGAKVNLVGGDGSSPLGAAVAFGDEATVKLLLDRGAQVHGGSPVDSPLISAEMHGGSPVDSPLISAEMHGKVAMVKLMLEHGADPNAGGWLGMTPLQEVMSPRPTPQQLEMLRLLLAHGADPNTPGQGGVSFLMIAGMMAQRTGRTEILELLKHGAVKLTLQGAASIGDVEGMKRSLASGAAIDALDAGGYTALILATRAGRTEAVKLLLEHGANPDLMSRPGPTRFTGMRQPMGNYPLTIAAAQGFTDIVKLLLDHGAKIDAQPPNPPAPPAGMPNYPNRSPDTALIAAAIGQHADTLALLLARGVDLKADQNQGLRALAAAISNGRGFRRPVSAEHRLPGPDGKIPGPEEIVPMLLKQSLDLHSGAGEAMVRAAGLDDGAMLRLLLDHGGDPNARGDNGSTPLLAALELGQFENVKLLLSRGANVNLTDNNGFTPLMQAVASEEPEIAMQLIDHGAKVNAADRSGDTALALAGMRGDVKACALLLDHGANVNAANAKGRTVLMQTIDDGDNASEERMQHWEHPQPPPMTDDKRPNPDGHPDTVQLLLKRGADIHAYSKDGITALKLAIDGRFPKVVKLLNAAEPNRTTRNVTQ